MTENGGQQRRWPWLAAFGVFLAALFVVPEAMRMMRPQAEAPDPQLTCYAEAVALHQHLHEVAGPDPAERFDYMADLEARMEDMIAWTRGLRRRDDPRAHAMRPVIAHAEEARTSAVARDPDTYRAAAWAEVQRCHDALFGGREAA